MIKSSQPPTMTLIERARKAAVYDGEKAIISFDYTIDDENNTFKVFLNVELKTENRKISLETNIAFEQHDKKNRHNTPHLQIENFNTDELMMKSGCLHILLLTDSQEHLSGCCNGFVYAISELLKKVENFLSIDDDLVDYFFNISALKELKKFKIDLYKSIYKSFKENKLTFEKENIYLIEYSGRKNEDELDTTNLFKVLSILLRMKLLEPILLEPILAVISEESKIKAKCSFDMGKWKEKVLELESDDLKHLNRENFIKLLNE